MAGVWRQVLLPLNVNYSCRFGRLLVRRRTVRWALLRILKTQKTKRRERPLGRGGRGSRAGATDGSRQPVSVGPLPQPAPLGVSTPASASLKSRKPTGSSSAGIARSRSRRSTAGSFETWPTCAPRLPRSSNVTTSAGASRSSRIARRSKRARNTSYAMRRSANVCPRTGCGTRRPTSSSKTGGATTTPSARTAA